MPERESVSVRAKPITRMAKPVSTARLASGVENQMTRLRQPGFTPTIPRATSAAK